MFASIMIQSRSAKLTRETKTPWSGQWRDVCLVPHPNPPRDDECERRDTHMLRLLHKGYDRLSYVSLFLFVCYWMMMLLSGPSKTKAEEETLNALLAVVWQLAESLTLIAVWCLVLYCLLSWLYRGSRSRLFWVIPAIVLLLPTSFVSITVEEHRWRFNTTHHLQLLKTILGRYSL